LSGKTTLKDYHGGTISSFFFWVKQLEEQATLDMRSTVEQEKKSVKMIEQLVSAMFRPIIVHPGWMDVTTKQKFRVKTERMLQVQEGNGEKITEATNYEVMVYIASCSMTAPLSQSWFRLYVYLFRQFYPEHSDSINLSKVDKLTILEERDLRRLKQWIYKKGTT